MKRGSYTKTRRCELDAFGADLKRRHRGHIGAMGIYRVELFDVISGEKQVQFYKNIVPDVALAMIANNFTDPTPDYDMLISHAELGTSATAVAAGDTHSNAAAYRNAIASRASSGKTSYATAFFSQTECSGTYREAAIYSNGTGTLNSGVIVSHVNINVVKSLTQKLTIDWTLIFLSV